MNDQTFYMGEALKEAVKAYHKNEVPIGCVIVYQDKIISKAHNKRVKKESTIAHAEIIAIEKANKVIGSWRLEDCDIYVTLEPCAMCAGAIMQARMRHLYFAASDPKSGALGGKFNLYKEDFNHTVGVTCGILESESKQLIQTFFKKLREK
jgi:tRNA(adenine34) deaminase